MLMNAGFVYMCSLFYQPDKDKIDMMIIIVERFCEMYLILGRHVTIFLLF